MVPIMPKPRLSAIFAALLFATFSLGAAQALAKKKTKKRRTSWGSFEAPIAQPPEAVGGYTKGCLFGGVALPEKGPGFETIRRQRRRYFGHPALAKFVTDYGRTLDTIGLGPVLVGDMSQPRGGPMTSGHRSHQMGLDVDLWFTRPDGGRGNDDAFASLVDERREAIDAEVFDARHAEMLRRAALDPAVARIFVGWVIKRELCRTVKGDRGWLQKIRPWWGHTRHFHVRLRCPEGSPECREQTAIPAGDGCGTEGWFSKAEVAKRKKEARMGPPKKAPRPKRPPRPPLPARCKALLEG